MVLDLRVGNSLAIQHEDRFIEVRIKSLTDTGCEVIDLEDKTHKVSFEEVYPVKITKRWLKDNDLTCMDENNNNEEEGTELNYIHSSLPITYSHTDHRLFVYSHIFPVKIKYVHHFQNALLDCGIEFTPIFKDSHYTQIDGVPIINFLGGLRRGRDFFDTNVAFGLNKMPKFQMSQPKAASKVGVGMMDMGPQINFKRAFRPILGIQDPNLKRIVRYVFNHINLTFTDRTAIIYVNSHPLSSNVYYISSEPISDLNSYQGETVASSWDKIVEFINNFNYFVQGDFDLGVVFDGRQIQSTDSELVKRGALLADILINYEKTGSKVQNRYYILRKETGNGPGEAKLYFKSALTGKEFPGFSEMFPAYLDQKYNKYVSMVAVSEEEWNNLFIPGVAEESPIREPINLEDIYYKARFSSREAVAVPGSPQEVEASEEEQPAVDTSRVNEEAVVELSPQPEVVNRILRKKPKARKKKI